MILLRTSIVAALLAGATSPAQACVGTLPWFVPTSSTSISVQSNAASLGGTLGQDLQSVIEAGIQMWRDNCDNYQTDFPSLSNGGSGDISITLTYTNSVSAQAQQRCAEFEPALAPDGSLDGGNINIWREQPDGRDCWGPDNSFMAGIIAHELGHVLGLDDSSCAGYIMASLVGTVQESECQEAGENYETLDEQLVDPKDPEEPAPQCEISPILIDLDRGELRLSSAEDGTWFDLDVDGRDEAAAWPAPGEEAGFLFLDRNGNGVVDDGSELFGEHTPQPPSDTPHGFSALAVFDTWPEGGNGDGLLNSGDRIFPHLRLWIDEDRNGWSDPGEILSLPAAGIVEIELRYVISGRRDRHGNQLRYVSRALHVDGTPRLAADVYLLVTSDP